MEGRCNECGCHNVALHHYHTSMCYECYEKMYYGPLGEKKVENDEPDFELKHDVAVIDARSTHYNATYFVTDSNIYSIRNPKRMVFDPDCRVKDYDKLVLFLLENMTIYDNAKGFDKVSYMFKEDDK